ncbi:hypothetical protein DFQ28_008146 [Apophysomyces sp. BC1034]|nr:hypothetical protein DFQ28_008146 [Apophysomyces sp. BC1034]
MSNQPGYKPVRRRRTTKSQSPTSTTTTISPTKEDRPDMSEFLTASSPSTQRSSSIYSDDSYNPVDTDCSSDSFFKSEHLQDTTMPYSFSDMGESKIQDPLQNLLQDVLQNASLSPEYDTDMMERLDSLAHVIHQSDDWTLPVTEQDDINNMQSWLEQLSANIETGDSIYPDILSPPQNQFYVSATIPEVSIFDPGHALYPSLDGGPDKPEPWSLPINEHASSLDLSSEYLNVFTSPESLSQNTASQYSTVSHEDEKTSTVTANFWGPVHSPKLETMVLERHAPSEPIDFSPSGPSSCTPQPSGQFETTKTETTALTPIKETNISYQDKKEVLHMLNVFNANNDTTSPSPKHKHHRPSPNKKEPTTPEECNIVTTSPVQMESRAELPNPVMDLLATDFATDNHSRHASTRASQSSSRRSSLSSVSSHCSCASHRTVTVEASESSPYATLTDMLRELSFQDDGDDAKTTEETTKNENKEATELMKTIEKKDKEDIAEIRERHAWVVDCLWKTVMRISLKEKRKNATINKKHAPAGTALAAV